MRSWRRTVVAAACQSEGLWLEMLMALLWVSSEVASQLERGKDIRVKRSR